MTTRTPRPAPRAAPRLAALDVLRTVAVVLVLVQHALVPPGALGLAGVLIFFGLSGYLITGLLVDELDRVGRLDIPRFYRRRFARLAPALVVMVLVTTAVLGLLGQGWGFARALSALTYVKNYALIGAGPGHPDPVLGHTWTLAVEEHFYLLWPVVLVVLRRRLTSRGLLLAVLGLCAVAQALRVAAVLAGVSDLALYYESLTHADALLYGAAAALAVRAGWRPGPGTAAVGAALIAAMAVTVEPLVQPAVVPLVGGVASALLVAGAARTLGTRSRGRFWRWVADRSYSLYLWHLPLIAISIAALGFDSVGGRVLAVALGVPVADASYRWVERPARAWLVARSDGRRAPVRSTAATMAR